MEEITLDYPEVEDVLEWEEESREYFHKSSNWIGAPDYSVVAYVLSSNRPIEAKNVSRIEPLVSEPQVLMSFRDIDTETWEEYLEDEDFTRKRNKISQEMAGGFMDIPVYQSRIHDKAPGKIEDRYFSADAEIDSLRPNMSVCEEVQEMIEDSKDFALGGVEFTAMSMADDPVVALYELEDKLSFQVHFEYAGNDDAVGKFNDMVNPRGKEVEYAGVPGSVIIGQGNVYSFLPFASDVDLYHSEIEERLSEELSGILAAREGIEKEKV